MNLARDENGRGFYSIERPNESGPTTVVTGVAVGGDFRCQTLSTATPVHGYAQHGRELVGCKSPVRKRDSTGRQYTKCFLLSEVQGEGNCGEATNRGEEACEVSPGSQPAGITPKPQGYEQKRYRGFGTSEVSRPVTRETVPDRLHGR